MQIIAGLSKTMYWIGNLLFDFIYCFIIICISCLIISLFDKIDFMLPHLTDLLIIFSIASLNCLLIAYFVMNLNLSKQITVMMIKWPLYFVGFLIGCYDRTFVLLQSLAETTEPIEPKFAFLFKILSPPYNVLDSIFRIIDLRFLEFCKEKTDKSEMSICDKLIGRKVYNFENNLLAYLISMIIFSTLIFLVNFFSNYSLEFIEFLKLRFLKRDATQREVKTQRRESSINVNYLKDIKDPNVDKEIELTKSLIETGDLQSNILVVHDLYKLFGSFEAVSHLNFTVKREECFGLLGINGAGN